MKTGLILLLLILTITSCDTEKSFKCNCDTSDLVYNDSIMKSFHQNRNYFKDQMEYYHVPPLRSYGRVSFRLSITHSFSNYVQKYTLVEKDKGAELDVREYALEGMDCHILKRPLIKRYQIQLTDEQWNSIKEAVNENCYWTNKMAEGYPMMLDGGSWILEGFDPESGNCANREYTIDGCRTDYKNKLGDLCRKIKKYAHEERLHVYKD
ncbi:MAG: hypothetical protein ACO1N0_20190 [Fluviicola sp.]